MEKINLNSWLLGWKYLAEDNEKPYRSNQACNDENNSAPT
jgi:hypothetical protein